MEKASFKHGQAVVAFSSPILMLTVVAGMYLCYRYLPWSIEAIGGFPDRVHVTLVCLSIIAFAFFMIIAHIGNLRFLSPHGINPLESEIDMRIQVWGRILQNSLEQSFVFAILALTIASGTTFEIRLIPIATVFFLLARVIFAIGYHISWEYRAPGMGMTFGTNIAMFLAVGYMILH